MSKTKRKYKTTTTSLSGAEVIQQQTNHEAKWRLVNSHCNASTRILNSYISLYVLHTRMQEQMEAQGNQDVALALASLWFTLVLRLNVALVIASQWEPAFSCLVMTENIAWFDSSQFDWLKCKTLCSQPIETLTKHKPDFYFWHSSEIRSIMTIWVFIPEA